MMKTKMRFLIIPAILFVLIVGCSPINAELSDKAPDFTLPDLDGKSFCFSDLKGKVVILDFWATWCPPCVAEIPHFQSLYQQYREQGLEVVGISLDRGDASAVKSFVKAHGVTYPILIGNQKVTEDYGGIRGIPTTFVIDRQGRIIKKFVGYREKEVFESLIQELL